MIVLESKRLIFRQHALQDIDSYCAMEMDPEVRRFVGGAPRTRPDAERRFRSGLGEPRSRLGVWAAVLKSDGKYVGRSGLYPHIGPGGEVDPAEAVLSFYIAREHWNQGFASEAAGAFIDFGWNDLRLSRIVATVQEGNSASTHILKKFGFSLTRTDYGVRTFLNFELLNPHQKIA